MKLLSIAHNFSKDKNQVDAQKTLLMNWWSALCDKKVKPIENAKVSFKLYNFKDYPDQVALKDFIYKEYVNKQGELYWAGTQYKSIDILCNDLAEQKLIAELLVEEI